MHPMSEDREPDLFDSAVSRIVRAAQKFKEVAGDDVDKFMAEENNTFIRIPLSGFCLQLAHQVWLEALAQQRYAEELRRQPAGPAMGYVPFGMLGASMLHPGMMAAQQQYVPPDGGGPPGYMPHPKAQPSSEPPLSRRRRAPQNENSSVDQLVNLAAQHMTPEQRLEVIRGLQAVDAEKQ